MKKDYEEEFCVPENGNTQGAWESLLGNLGTATNRDIAIEFECGGCCKKVLNGERIIPIISLGVIVLLPPNNETLLVKLFGEEEIIERQMARAIVIFIDRICSIEFGAVEID